MRRNIFSLFDKSNASISPIQLGNTLKKWHIKKKSKNATLNGCISKARVNSESKPTFTESSINFLPNSVVFPTLYPHGYAAGGPNP